MDCAISRFSPSHILAWSETRISEAPENAPCLALWKPAGVFIALGLSQDPECELEIEALRRDSVGLVRRQSGGGSVLLYPGVLCWEAWASCDQIRAAEGDSGIRPSYAFLSRPVSVGLRRLGVEVFPAGICDLSTTFNEGRETRKIAGTAQLRRRGQVLVHGSLLVSADVGVLGKYLKFPSEQPDYRLGRSHRDFCATIAECLGRPKPDDVLFAAVEEAITGAARGAGWRVIAPPDALSPEALRLEREKYLSEAWNWSRVRPKA